jgi:hypothetical protein
MATAAVADAAAKDQRQRELDSKIRDARDKLATLLEQAPAYEPKRTRDGPYVLHNASHTPPGIYEALTSICVMPSRLLRESSRRGNRAAYLRSLGKGLGVQEQREWWKTPPVVWDKFGEMIAEEEAAGTAVGYREPVNAVQFSKQRERINNLVDQLLVETYRGPDGVASTPDLLESAWNNIRMLRSSGYPKYQHSDLDPAAAAAARRDLSAVTRNIFRDWKLLKDDLIAVSRNDRGLDKRRTEIYRKRREYFVGKLCHNLLIARFGPDIYTYNTLIYGFKSVGEARFGQAVVDSLLASRLKPTTMTLVALLQHYNQNDIVGFYNIIRRITGDDHRGVLLRLKPVKEVKDDPTLFRWAQNVDAAVAHGFVTERPVVTEVVVEALLDRLISFRMVRHAAVVLAACLRERWSISTRYVRRVVALCVAQVDRVAAVELLRTFLADVKQLAHFTRGEDLPESSLRNNLYRLLQICESSADRDLIARSGAGVQTTLAWTNLNWSSRVRHFRTALWSAFAEQRLHAVASCTSSIGAVLASGRIDEEQLKTLSTKLERINQQHMAMTAQNWRFQAMARIDWLTTEYEVNKAKTQSYERELIQIRLKHRQDRAFNVRFDSSIPLEYRLSLLDSAEVAENRSIRLSVSALVQRAAELKKETEHILYEALPNPERRRLWKLWRSRERVFAMSPLVDHWSEYLQGVSRQWEEQRGHRSVVGTRGAGTREQHSRTTEDAFRVRFFESSEPLDRVKIPVPAL